MPVSATSNWLNCAWTGTPGDQDAKSRCFPAVQGKRWVEFVLVFLLGASSLSVKKAQFALL